MRQRRADARIRLKILADSSLLSGHHASHVPLVAAAPRAPGRAAELDVVTVALAAILTDVSTLRAEVAGLARSSRPPWRRSPRCEATLRGLRLRLRLLRPLRRQADCWGASPALLRLRLLRRHTTPSVTRPRR